MRKINRFAEFFWLTMAIVMTILATYWSFEEGFKDSLLWYGFALFLFVYYIFRRFMRIKIESIEENRKNKK